MTREWSKMDGAAAGAGRRAGPKDRRASPSFSADTDTAALLRAPAQPVPFQRTGRMLLHGSAGAGERNKSVSSLKLRVSHCHLPASPLMEGFGQEMRAQRCLGLAVSLMNNHVLWKGHRATAHALLTGRLAW